MDVEPHILNLVLEWAGQQHAVADLPPPQPEQNQRYPLNRRPDGPQSR